MQFDFCCVISHCFALCTSTGWQSNRLLRSQYRNEWQGFKVENAIMFPTFKQNYKSNITKAITENSFQLLFWFDLAKMFSYSLSLFSPPSHHSSPSFFPTLFNCVVRFRNIYFRKKGIFHVFSLKPINPSFYVHVTQGT